MKYLHRIKDGLVKMQFPYYLGAKLFFPPLSVCELKPLCLFLIAHKGSLPTQLENHFISVAELRCITPKET